jgi:GTPase SAR1 family protein
VKIAFIGTHGVGKTTLCYDLASRLKRQDRVVDLVQEVARTCPLPINRETTVDAQAWILHTQIAQELAASRHDGIVICDRSVLDNYAYLVHHAGRRPDYDALVRQWVTTYDCLFKVPIIDPPTFDGKRDVSQAFQHDIDRGIDALADAFDVGCHRLDPERRDEWVDTVLTTSGLPLHPPQIDLFRATSEDGVREMSGVRIAE